MLVLVLLYTKMAARALVSVRIQIDDVIAMGLSIDSMFVCLVSPSHL